VMPSLERALRLHVGKVVVPFEFGDAGNPLRAERQKREESEGSHDD
jgi:hypothetical protein